MPRHAPPLPFSPHYDFHVIKPLTIGTERLRLGDPFPKDGVSERRLRQMYEARMISPIPPSVLPMVETAPAREEPKIVRSIDEAHVAVADARARGEVKIEHKGFGRWYVVDGEGANVAGPFSREDAENLLG